MGTVTEALGQLFVCLFFLKLFTNSFPQTGTAVFITSGSLEKSEFLVKVLASGYLIC